MNGAGREVGADGVAGTPSDEVVVRVPADAAERVCATARPRVTTALLVSIALHGLAVALLAAGRPVPPREETVAIEAELVAPVPETVTEAESTPAVATEQTAGAQAPPIEPDLQDTVAPEPTTPPPVAIPAEPEPPVSVANAPEVETVTEPLDTLRTAEPPEFPPTTEPFEDSPTGEPSQIVPTTEPAAEPTVERAETRPADADVVPPAPGPLPLPAVDAARVPDEGQPPEADVPRRDAALAARTEGPVQAVLEPMTAPSKTVRPEPSVARRPERSARPPPRPQERRTALIAKAPPRPTPSAGRDARTSVGSAATVTGRPASVQVSDYRSIVSAEINRRKSYPAGARQTGAGGRVVIRFTVGSGGRVVNLALLQSSGHPVLDAAARSLVLGLSLPPPPGGTYSDVTGITYRSE